MTDHDDLLRRYLLGELSEEEANRLEARLIQDDELFESVEALEADLLDEVAHGRLSPEERQRIVRRLASSPQGRLRLAVVRDLGRMEGRIAPGRRVLPGPWGRMDLSLPSVRALAAAAMLAIAVGSVWLGLQTTSMPQAEEQVAEETPAPPPPVVVPPIPPAVPTAETPAAPEPDRVAQAEPAPAPEPPAAVPYVFQLALTALRGSDDNVPELRVPSGTERVDIQLPLISGDEGYPAYQVVLRDASGTELIRREDLKPNRSNVLVLPVEAKLLRPGRYSVEVYAGGDNLLASPELEVPAP